MVIAYGTIALDVTDAEAARAAIQAVVDAFGRLDAQYPGQSHLSPTLLGAPCATAPFTPTQPH